MNRSQMLLFFLPFSLLFFYPALLTSNLLEQKAVIMTLFMMMWMVLWWIFEILPLGITALIPLVFLPIFNLMKIETVSALYANPVIYLFLGGFMIARGLEKTKLDERFALWTLLKVGQTDQGIIKGFVIITAFLSMWISNTATTVMMVPIALSVLKFLKTNLPIESQKDLKSFCVVLFLSIAYAANVGGIMTPIGSPPNVVFVGYLESLYQIEIDFWKWMMVTIPLALVFLSLMLLILSKINSFKLPIPQNFKHFIQTRYLELGPIHAAQKVTVFVFLFAVTLWIFKQPIHWILGADFLNDTSIAIMSGILLFLIPFNKKGTRVLDSKDIAPLPWDIVLLFGGGLALAGALKEVGLINLTTEYLSSVAFFHPYLLIFALTASALLLTEVMSNVALCVVALPVIMQLGVSQGLSPVMTAMPVTIATSFAFMMPISTPPNAIVFATETMTVKDMIKAGFLMNIFGLILVMSVGFFMIQFLLI